MSYTHRAQRGSKLRKVKFSYDVRTHNRKVSYRRLKSVRSFLNAQRISPSNYFVETNLSVDEIRQTILPALCDDDDLTVEEMD